MLSYSSIYFNPLRPNVTMNILHNVTVLYTFRMVLTREMCLITNIGVRFTLMFDSVWIL